MYKLYLISPNFLICNILTQGLGLAAIACPPPLAVRPTIAPSRCNQPIPLGDWKDEVYNIHTTNV